jgi:transformation/transcription domain-associated protein
VQILVEEGHSLPHLVHIWQLIVVHADLFYPSRAIFVPQMVNSLSKLAFQMSPPENRRLALDLAALVIRWAKKTQDGLKAAAQTAQQEAAAAAEEVKPAAAEEEGDATMTDADGTQTLEQEQSAVGMPLLSHRSRAHTPYGIRLVDILSERSS